MPRSEAIAHDQACLYRGHVMHVRLTPFVHKFRYRIFTLLLDIDRLDDTMARLRLLRFDRFGLMSFHLRDHGPRDGSALRPWIEMRLAEHNLPNPARIRLLSFPRILGYVFNPLSVYYCEDAEGRLESIVYEVKNAFGDQHPYVVPVAVAPDGVARHEVTKCFFVSPFIGMDQTYRFTILPPGERLALKIRQHDRTGPWLIATQSGVRHPLSDRELARQWFTHPFMTLKVFAAIRWQALQLALKGARFHSYRGPYPDPAAAPPTLARRFGSIFGWKPREISD